MSEELLYLKQNRAPSKSWPEGLKRGDPVIWTPNEKGSYAYFPRTWARIVGFTELRVCIDARCRDGAIARVRVPPEKLSPARGETEMKIREEIPVPR